MIYKESMVGCFKSPFLLPTSCGEAALDTKTGLPVCVAMYGVVYRNVDICMLLDLSPVSTFL